MYLASTARGADSGASGRRNMLRRPAMFDRLGSGAEALRMVDGVDASLVSLPQVSKAAQMRLCTWVKAGTRQSRQILRVLKLLPPIDAHATIQSIAVTAGGSMRRSGCDRAGPGSVRYAMLATSRSRSRSAPTSYLP